MTSAATKDMWTTKPMPDKHGILDYPYEYTEEQFVKISKGVVPEAMEEKWFMYVEDNTLFMHRSWTGYCMFVVEFVKESDKFKVTRAVVNRDPDQYSAQSDEHEVQMLRFLIDAFFLHTGVDMP